MLFEGGVSCSGSLSFGTAGGGDAAVAAFLQGADNTASETVGGGGLVAD